MKSLRKRMVKTCGALFYRLDWLRLAIGLAAVLAALQWASATARAVTFIEQAERLQHINAFLLDLRPGQPPRVPDETVLDFALEILPAPDIDNRVGAKDEPIASPAAIPRLRLRYITASGFMVGGTWNPDVEFEGYRAPWTGWEVGYRFVLAGLHTELRLFAISVQVVGPIADKGAEDEFDVYNRGGDLRLGVPLGTAMIYAGGGEGRSESTLRIESDGARLDAETTYTYILAGVGGEWGPMTFTYEQYWSEDYLQHYSISASVRF